MKKIVNLLPQDRPTVTIYTEGSNNKVAGVSNLHNFTQDLTPAHNCPKVINKTKMKENTNQKTVNTI